MERKRNDLVIIGGGSAGLVCAQVAVAVGARVVLIEQEDEPGGDCLWTGCVPSKTLISVAQRCHDARSFSEWGITGATGPVDWHQVMAHVRRAQQLIAPYDSRQHLAQIGVQVLHGRAIVTAPHEVTVTAAGSGTQLVRARNVVVASGSAPVLPSIRGIERVPALTTDTVWSLPRRPLRLLVIGGGASGCELAQAFARLGTSVVLVEGQDRLLPTEDTWVSQCLEDAMEADGVDLRLGTRVVEIEPGIGTFDSGEEVAFDEVLVTTGRVPRTDGLFTGSVNVKLDERGHVVVDRRQRSSVRSIWAAGDVTGQLELTSAAGVQGANAALNALFHMRRHCNLDQMPHAVFTDPQVASVGLTERAAHERNIEVEVERLPMAMVDRAVTADKAVGEMRLLVRGGRLLGATVVSSAASEQISQLASVVGSRGGLARLAGARHAYPTMIEASQRLALSRQFAQAGTGMSKRVIRMAVRLLGRLP